MKKVVIKKSTNKNKKYMAIFYKNNIKVKLLILEPLV